MFKLLATVDKSFYLLTKLSLNLKCVVTELSALK